MPLTPSTLFINEPGAVVGISKGRFVVRKQRKTLLSIPQSHCERVIVAAGSVSISSDFIATCARLGIGIDFFDRSLKEPLSQLSSQKSTLVQMSRLQLDLLGTPTQLQLAKAFLRAKTKNQINYLRYMNKYHKQFADTVTQMRRIQKEMLEKAKSTSELMGFEGHISNLYWQAIALMLQGKVTFEHRRTKGATDIVNTALNYGYGILYGRVHYHALRAGLSLNISFLHAPQENRPTLVYDIIEEFRTFVVDRTVLRMFNQKEPLKLAEDGLLDDFTRKRIAAKVIEKLASKTRYKNASVEIDHVISQQAYFLARAVKGLATYRGFVGRY